jgi:NDP-hexose-3-ketoreductase
MCLAEAVVFSHHPQIAVLKRLLLEHGSATRLIATFTMPPLPEDNFRNQPELGGGSLYDLGPYASAVSRLFFESAPDNVACNVVSNHPNTKVDTAFSVLASYSCGRSFVGHFGFDTEYQNRVTLFGPEMAATVDRIFTTPADFENHIDVNRSNQQSRILVEAGDPFEGFFANVIESVEKNRFSAFAKDLRQDAEFLETMRTVALGEYRR